MNLTYIIKRPVITEKSLKDASKGVFTFIVSKSATKDQISQAVSRAFDVDVVSVNTQTTSSKTYRSGRRRQVSHTVPGKKAHVTLESGQKINLFDIETE